MHNPKPCACAVPCSALGWTPLCDQPWMSPFISYTGVHVSTLSLWADAPFTALLGKDEVRFGCVLGNAGPGVVSESVCFVLLEPGLSAGRVGSCFHQMLNAFREL